MIVLNLNCGNSHLFEGWFRSAEDFRQQNESGLLSCPLCSDRKIARLPSGPHVKRNLTEPDQCKPAEDAAPAQQSASSLRDLLQALIRNTDDVGSRFPEEARKIHYEEVPQRSIRGIATPKETRDLLDEGIEVLPLPIPPSSEVH